jgi:hypothetical protein
MTSGQTLLWKGPRPRPTQAKEPGVRPQVAPTVSLAEKPSLATTTSAPTTAATCAPAPRRRMAATPAYTGRSPLKSSRMGRHRPPRRRRRAGVRTRQSKSTNAALAACDVLDDPPVQSATREGPQTCPTCVWRDSRPCGARIATPGPSGRRQHQRRRQSQLSQRARHAAADDARGRPGPRRRSSPPPRGR